MYSLPSVSPGSTSTAGNHWTWRAHYAPIYTILRKGLECPQILVSMGSWDQSPSDTEGQLQLSFWGITSRVQIYSRTGLGPTNPGFVQGSIAMTLLQHTTCRNKRKLRNNGINGK